MTAVPPCPHYLVTLFLSKVIFFFSGLSYFFPPTDSLSSCCRSKWIWNFFSDPHSLLPQSVPSLSSWLQFHIHFSPSSFSHFCHLILSVVFGFFSAELSFFPLKQFNHVTFLFRFLCVFHTLCSKYLVIGTQFLYKETKLVPASSWRAPYDLATVSII